MSATDQDIAAFARRLDDAALKANFQALTSAVVKATNGPVLLPGQPAGQVDAALEVTRRQIAVVVPLLLHRERRGVGIGARGAVLLAPGGGAEFAPRQFVLHCCFSLIWEP